MDVTDTLKNVLQTNAAVEIMNEVTLATLRSSRETCIEARERLDAKRDVGHWTDAESIDWGMLVLDIAALDRVIDYYGG